MHRQRQININQFSWLNDYHLQKILSLLNMTGDHARLVGGCVRDTLIGRPVNDIDIATTHLPQENMDILEKAGIRIIPTGLKHGTITAISGGEPFEITTLREDVVTDGRHAEVEFTDEWERDAARRDFTVNALYLDIHGVIHDYHGGLEDIDNLKIRFIGNAEGRIKEDALRILRFYRFNSQLNISEIDQEGLEATRSLSHLIAGLSGERIWSELKKILMAPFGVSQLKLIHENGIDEDFLPRDVDGDRLSAMIERAEGKAGVDLISRLASYIRHNENSIDAMSKRMRFSNKERENLEQYCKIGNENIVLSEAKDIRKALYHRGKGNLLHYLKNSLVRNEISEDEFYEKISYIIEYEIPNFPVMGKDLAEKGIKPGKEMGEILRGLEEKWIESDFILEKTLLIKSLFL